MKPYVITDMGNLFHVTLSYLLWIPVISGQQKSGICVDKLMWADVDGTSINIVGRNGLLTNWQTMNGCGTFIQFDTC